MHDVVIVGSGLAGSACALRFAATGRQVALFERRRLPADKLCGEFLSPEVRRAADVLGVGGRIRDAGALPVRRTLITTSGGARFERPLPRPGLALSRTALDRIMLSAVAEAGVDVHEEEAVEDIVGDLPTGFTVRSGRREVRSRAVVGAWGRRDRLDRRLERPGLRERAPWVAFKAHFTGSGPDGTVELHCFPGGYCGVSRVEGDLVNVCWIVHRDVLRRSGGSPERVLAMAGSRNAALGGRLHDLQRVGDAFLSVSQLRFEPRATFAHGVCLVGDAAGMIAPLCGDGMAMAFDSATLAARALDRFLEDRDADGFRRDYTKSWTSAFRRRMLLGRWLHAVFVHPAVAGPALRTAAVFPRLGDAVIRATRGH